MSVEEPNVVLALATTYNERGVAGYTHVVTNAEDQRKINCIYELSKNNLTGKGTLTLAKRPGVTAEASTWGVSSQDVFLIIKGAIPISPWLIAKQGNNIVNVVTATSSVILNSADHNPAFIDKTITYTASAGTEYVVVQTRRTSVSFVQRAFFANLNTTWTEISDGDFTSITHIGKMEHLDGYALILSQNNLIWNSDLNSLASWPATGFIAKQIHRDRPVGLARLGKQILAFGEETFEVFYNAGNTTGSPLSPLGNLAKRYGLVPPPISLVGAGHYYCTIGGRIFFAGRESGIRYESGATFSNSVGIYSYDGSNIEKVSSTYIDKIFSEIAETSFYSVNSVGVNGQVAAAFLLTSPNATSQRALLFFPEWKEWFEWTSSKFSTVNNGHFLPCATNGKDKLYFLSNTDNWQDDGTSYQWLTQFRVPSNGASRKRMTMYGLDADTDTSTNTISVDVSDNDCASFYGLPSLDLTRDRKLNFRGGSFYKRHIRLSATDARPKRIHTFLARVE